MDPHSGRVSIIDRISSCFKLSNGEFITPERLESSFLSARLVDQAAVYGDAFMAAIVLIVAVNPARVGELRSASSAGVACECAGCCRSEKCQCVSSALTDGAGPAGVDGMLDGAGTAIHESVLAAGRQAGLQCFELPAGVVVHIGEFSFANEFLTETGKLNRR